MIEKYFGNLTKDEVVDEFDLLVEKSTTKGFKNLVVMIKEFYLYILKLEEQNKNAIKYLKETAVFDESTEEFLTFVECEECKHLLDILKGGE